MEAKLLTRENSSGRIRCNHLIDANETNLEGKQTSYFWTILNKNGRLKGIKSVPYQTTYSSGASGSTVLKSPLSNH